MQITRSLTTAVLTVLFVSKVARAQAIDTVEIQLAAITKIAARAGNASRVAVDVRSLVLDTSAHSTGEAQHSSRLLERIRADFAWRTVSYRDVVKCEPQTRPVCHLTNVDLFLAVSTVQLRNVIARVDVYAYTPSPSKRDPISREGYRVTLRQVGGKWTVDQVRITWQS